MKQALARMYADPFMKEYLFNAIAIANTNALTLLQQAKFTEAQTYAARSSALRQLLEKGKENFTHFEKIKSSLKTNAKN